MYFIGFTTSCLPNTSADPRQCKEEGESEELLKSFDEVGLLQAKMSTSRRWCTREGGSSELLRSLGGGLDEVVAGLLAMLGRVVVPHREAEVGFGSIALLFGPSRNLRWVEREVEQIRCLTRKDGRLLRGAYPPTSPPFLGTSCLFYSTSRCRRRGPPGRQVSPTS